MESDLRPFRFPPAFRVTRKPELEAVRHEGKRFRTTHLEVRYVASLLRHSRVGTIVPKHPHTAPERNRVKRRLRELIRTTLLPGIADAPARDIVVRSLPSAYAADFDALRRDVGRIVQRLASSEGG